MCCQDCVLQALGASWFYYEGPRDFNLYRKKVKTRLLLPNFKCVEKEKTAFLFKKEMVQCLIKITVSAFYHIICWPSLFIGTGIIWWKMRVLPDIGFNNIISKWNPKIVVFLDSSYTKIYVKDNTHTISIFAISRELRLCKNQWWWCTKMYNCYDFSSLQLLKFLWHSRLEPYNVFLLFLFFC